MKIEKVIRLVRPDIRRALKEDCPRKDITTSASVPAKAEGTATVIAKTGLVVCGTGIFAEVIRQVDKGIKITILVRDGQKVRAGKAILKVSGKSASILRAERVALNYLQRMCGIASLTAQFVAKVKGTKVKILDTRKTVPNMRILDRYSVVCGGGCNHRMDLSDAPLIKENHIRNAGGILSAVTKVKKAVKKEVILEVTNRDEVLEGLIAGAEIILLDNMPSGRVKNMVKLIGGRALVEVSGGVDLRNVRRYALSGADRISVGALTHSVPSADLSLLFN